MHGDYKTPGGKLVRVDFSIDDGTVRNPIVSGDFFLYPDDALSDITHALDGITTTMTEPEIASRVAAAIPPGTEWLGSSPEALATAVRRALVEGESSNG